MNKYWLLVVTAIFLLAMVGLEQKSSDRLSATRKERREVREQLEQADARVQNTARESKEYQTVRDAAKSIRKQIRWETDSGRLLQQVSLAAAEAGVRLNSSRFLTDGPAGSNLIAGGAFQRFKFDINAVGTFAAMVDFIGRLESSKQPMIVDSFTMNADRDTNNRGQVRMQVSCIVPTPSPSPNKTP